jgi:hypothetical protein
LVPTTEEFLQTILAAETDLAEGQSLLEEQTISTEEPVIYRTGTLGPTVSKWGGKNLEPR